ncbi:GDPD-domain-containing protein [Metschnikowia bicuspidata var. bicuspidata NRRL YB-4993]|uniref:GDPD-domain-containing protein n=1 Tax=Metschnikowia bicuspidata var. bicuspidata NRRL YB-4993 TaxID=869754 RepID=A0A1A0HGX8_9ASCO|nr:GDPD-domain-containing protein [Metschnikowia bicuspidata var. bicuspidata NRRL YB-4993]OBA23251.1 GDPD-domain-containing protein [Metschnikowia bicuspidata var. bicuspidata NRRL YB-4993]
MKFGKTFASHQIPEWSTYYMNYKHLKKTIKAIDGHYNYHSFTPLELPEIISQTLSQFFFELDRDIERVSEFYNSKLAEYTRRSHRIVHVLGYADGQISLLADTTDELDEIVSILLELRSAYRNLKWFGELNHKGFVKILKKLDKKLAYLTTLANDQLRSEHPDETLRNLPLVDLPCNNKDTYLSTRVDALPFANGIDLSAGLETISDILVKLGEQQAQLASALPVSDLELTVEDLNVLRIGHNRKYSFDKESLLDLYEGIKRDNGLLCIAQLRVLPLEQILLKLLLSLLNKATLSSSFNCIDMLFAYILDFHKQHGLESPALADPQEISGRNFFHQHVVSLGKRQLSKEQSPVVAGESSDLSRLYGNKSGPDGILLAPVRVDGLVHVFLKLAEHPQLQRLLIARDSYHRTPLHYAAQYGTKDVCKVILECLSKWELVDLKSPTDDARVWGDKEGLTPLHLAIIGKHPKTCHNLVSFTKVPLSCPNLLLLATRLGCADIVKDFLSEQVVSIDYTDAESNNETALYIASKMNCLDLVRYLLEHGANTELGELVFGWTPIFAAAAEGLLDVVNELKGFGAAFHMADDSGWLPMEHASLRGHLAVADALTPPDTNLLLYNIDDPSENKPRVPNALLSKSVSAANSPFINPVGEDSLLSTSSIDKLPELNRLAVNEVYRQFKQLDNGSSNSIDVIPPHDGQEALSMSSARDLSRSRSPLNRRKMKPIKSFGHRFLGKDEQLILITLGTTDTRDKLSAVELNKISISQSFFTELDTALSLVVTCHNKTTKAVVEDSILVDLPLEDQHGSATDPLIFKLKNNTQISDVYMTFDIVPTYQYPLTSRNNHCPKVFGRGVAFLESAYSNVGQNLRTLNNNVTVPIVEHNTLDILGKVRFEFMCIQPFIHPNMSINRSDTYWKQLVSTRVIGHRGLGKNFNNKNSLQLGENTVESFIAAASLGASYVEFDVQLTKDFVPVIYHDFLVAESGGDIPMHMLTAEQFLGFSEHEDNGKAKLFSFDKTKLNGNVSRNFALDDELLGKYNRPRSMSSYPSAPNMTSSVEEEELDKEFRDQMARRMKLTKTWKEKGFKGNARGSSIASNFVTLKELFKRLPKNVGFNMELKYPMLDEAQHESMGEFAFDMNFYVDTILKVVYDENTSGRDILFSSFHPDICVLLSLKQPTMPILYLTEAGTNVMADIRASSLQNAIRFAKKWNLLGIVSAAETLVKTPRLAQVVKSSGLVCVTYGVQNNDPEACKIQMKAGVDAVIADSVLAVREGLRSEGGQC